VDFALRVEQECWKRGAHTLLRPVSFARERIKLSIKLAETLKEMEPLLVRIGETEDVDIYIGEYDDPNFTAGLADRWKLGAPCRQRYREIMERGKSDGHIWAGRLRQLQSGTECTLRDFLQQYPTVIL